METFFASLDNTPLSEFASEAFPFYCQFPYRHYSQRTEQLHYHNTVELGYCFNGEGVFASASGLKSFQKGSLTLFNRLAFHIASSPRESGSLWGFLFFDPERLLLPHFPELQQSPVFHLFRKGKNYFAETLSQPSVEETFRRIISAAASSGAESRIRIKALLLELLFTIEPLFDREKKERERAPSALFSEQLAPAVELIHREYTTKEITVETLARECGMSLRSFNRAFRETLGSTPHRYLNDFRVMMSSGDLRNSSRSLEQIADANGFEYLSTFYRNFKRCMGVTPKEWRQGNG